MKHLHLKQIASTQSFLLSSLKGEEHYDIVSCQIQNQGVGRGENSWDGLENSLAFSFLTTPNDEVTLSPLEVGVHICDYFKNELTLKWPNDIFKGEKKVGGILTKLINNKLVVGIGLNYGLNHHDRYGHIFDKSLDPSDYEGIPRDFVNYFHKHRLAPNEVIKRWQKLCFHLNVTVTITDDSSINGQFIGIGKYGEALIETKDTVESVFAGSLLVH